MDFPCPTEAHMQGRNLHFQPQRKQPRKDRQTYSNLKSVKPEYWQKLKPNIKSSLLNKLHISKIAYIGQAIKRQIIIWRMI